MIDSINRKAFMGTVALFFLIPSLLFAQSGKEGLTPLQLAQLQQVEDVVLSPSGTKAAYTLSRPADPRKKNKPVESSLYLYNLDTQEASAFITTLDVGNIAFRPKKKTITFLSKREEDETTGLFEIAMSGGEARRILSFPTDIVGYTWAPDGDHLAFMAPDTAQEEASVLPYEPEIYEENLKQRRGFVTNVAEGNDPTQLQAEGSIYQVHWNPAGDKLAIAIAPSPLIDDYFMNQKIAVVDRQGENILATVDHKAKLGKVAWSPDGTKLAMLAGSDVHDPIAGRLLIASAQGGAPTQLQPHYNGKFEQFQWVDNSTLSYLSSEGVWSTYGYVNADGTNRTTIIDRGGSNLSAYDRASNGAAVFIADSSAHPSELYYFQPQNSKLERLTYNNSWLKEVDITRQQPVSWTTDDGTELQGILVFPLDHQKEQQYPLITVVHGGPESHYNNGWVTSYSEPGQVGAAQNYFVFYPNYRGSTGRGETFAKSSQGDPAGKEFDDIVAGVDELVKGGLVDSSKVGVTGGSYGGYATGWLSTKYTDHFAAGVMFVGVSNNISKWGTSDIPEELYLVHSRKRIWEDYGFFLRRSPIYHAGETETPLLIAAGKEDTRVDPGQSYELYRHIKTRTNTPVRLVLYPGEGHGNKNATARYDYNQRMMRWFNKYIKGESEERPDTEFESEAVPVQAKL
ncbi:S9 family peptidase [Fodinibius salsisoli]|uniref:S9 family peptidase n=1 Tax=Fodinibius salsisoli TaxID=2820877 RepID=A0ABT3PI72_9BACT|nr:S9 family peptidase [Fodinibius salsisoli]MCW9705617.1 S9 family peptidase [Fodinibius salsisoli]